MTEKYIPSFINYTGGKYKILPQILPLFPEEYSRFVDLFCGSGVVGINLANTKDEDVEYILNDINENLINIMKTLKEMDYKDFVKKIDEIIEKYKLSNTFKNGYDYYGVNSSEGLSKINKDKYVKLRDDFNNNIFTGKDKWIALYVLIVFAFNNQIRFNKEGNFNLPTGKRDFNKSMRNKLKEMSRCLKTYNISLNTESFDSFKFKQGDFVYCDPPYLISTATYNENGLWTEEDEIKLLGLLDKLNKKGIKFALSNVTEHNNIKNDILIEWSKKYKVHFIEKDYKNSNYQKKAKDSKTREVLITNY